MAFDRSLRRAACVLLTAALLVPAWGGLARHCLLYTSVIDIEE